MPHLAGYLYNFLTDEFNNLSDGVKRAWEKDLKTKFENNEWASLVKNMLTATRDVRSKLIQFKIFNRLYWTPVRMHRAGLSKSTLCWKCNLEKGDLVHMLFTCSTLKIF